tara:strand:- start:218 stop:475 length:258 start_codon:yes stop_codon:yes gene_type:complete
MKKITKEQLAKVNEKQLEMSKITNDIGFHELQKHALLHQMAESNKELEAIKSELEKDYGPVNVDLKTGEYTEIEVESELVATEEV